MLAERLVAYDPQTGARLPVQKWELNAFFRERNDRAALRILERIPDRHGILDPAAVDRLLIRCACEMQGVMERLNHGRLVLDCLEPLIEGLKACGIAAPRIADMGCRNGYVMRWLARHLTVDLIGLDRDAALCGEATRLANKENLSACRFEVANPFRTDAQILISTNFIQSVDVPEFFYQHQTSAALGFVHFDWRRQPGGAALREPLSRYEAAQKRALADEGYTNCAAEAASSFTTTFIRSTPLNQIFMGVRRPYVEAVAKQFGERVGAWT